MTLKNYQNLGKLSTILAVIGFAGTYLNPVLCWTAFAVGLGISLFCMWKVAL